MSDIPKPLLSGATTSLHFGCLFKQIKKDLPEGRNTLSHTNPLLSALRLVHCENLLVWTLDPPLIVTNNIVNIVMLKGISDKLGNKY